MCRKMYQYTTKLGVLHQEYFVHRLDWGYVKIITLLHRGEEQNDNSITCGGEAQMITILHKGGGSLGTTKNVRVINRSAGCPKKLKTE